METNKQRIIAAVWENPAPAFGGGEWRPTAGAWEYVRGGEWAQRGAVRLLRSRDGEGITVFFNHGSGRAGAVTDIFDYWGDANGAGGFVEALRGLAQAYNIPLQLSEQERESLRRSELAREVAASLVENLRTHPDGPAGLYLHKTRRFELGGPHFGQLTADSLRDAADSLKNRGKTWAASDWEALGLTEARARAGYNVVLPYYRNGIVTGFVYRNVEASPSGPKYLYSEGLSRGGYCDRLTAGEPAVIVEGQLDAVRLIQQGVKNVVAIGGAKPGADIARLLRSRGITEAVYIPDAETDERGRRKTRIVSDAVRALQALTVDGVRVLTSVLLLDLPTPEGANAKTDADTFGADHPGELAGRLALEPVEAWAWEVEQLRANVAAIEQEKGRAAAVAVEGITAIYTAAADGFTRERIRRHVAGCEDLARYGVTPEALADLDEWNRGRDYYNTIQAAASDLNKAVQEHADAGTVAAIVRRLSDAQGSNSRDEWDAQLSEPYADELAALRAQPDTLKTKWLLGNIDKAGAWRAYERIEFYPADIAVFCAATSHGKTAVLFEAALDLVRQGETCLFVSCEENKRQLLQRALNVYLSIDTTDTGKDAAGGYCFIRGTRKKAIRAALTGAPSPEAYGEFMGVSSHFDALKTAVLSGVEAYGRDIRPRLKFVHTEADAESICNNILHTVAQARKRGQRFGAVFVDYVQLLTSAARGFSRTDELKDICKALKDCAARLEIPVIVAAQLNREVLRNTNAANGTPLDNITVANIGESADIERIAHDIYLVWQTDKTPLQWYADRNAEPDAAGGFTLDGRKIAAGIRSRRLFTRSLNPADREIKAGYLYVEQLKARDGLTGGWGLLPFDGERGTVGNNDITAMQR